ncbi:hypothetical protein JCM10213v2_004758 [Rhodosporidiobolus nylandii]
MNKLPDELVLEVASYLDARRNSTERPPEPKKHRGYWAPDVRALRLAAQARLAALARTNRRFYRLLVPVVLSSPLLASVEKADAWTRAYNEATNPFELARSGALELSYPRIRAVCTAWSTTGSWEPDSFLPAQPPSIDVPLALSIFSRLTSVNLDQVHITDSFLPALLGPGTCARRQLRTLTVRNSHPSPGGVGRTLSFLLDILPFVEAFHESLDELGDAYQDYLWQGMDEARRRRKPTRFELLEEDKERAELVDCARGDFGLYCRLWFDGWPDVLIRSEPNAFFTPPCGYPALSPWSSLVTLFLPLPEFHYLALVFFTSSFPSLRDLTVELNEDPMYISRHFFLEILWVMRKSITRRPTAGVILPPGVDAEMLDDIRELCDRPALGHDDPWPPVAPSELPKHDHRYFGPQLDRLDLSRLDLEYDEE